MLVDAYIDESGTHNNSPVISLAGYVYKQKNTKQFSRRFSKILKQYHLPYFHMVDCAHGVGPFSRLTRKQRIKVETKLIELVKEYSEYGFCVSLDRATYIDQLPDELKYDLGGEYAFCVRECLTMVRRWAERNEYPGKIAYFFESGHKHQGEANRILNESFKNSTAISNKFRYFSHSFEDKENIPLQSADLLAWLWQNEIKNRGNNRNSRKDLIALIRPQDAVLELNNEIIKDAFSFLRNRYNLRKTGAE